MGGISLKPGEHWSQSVHCYDLWEEDEEEEVANMISKFKTWRGSEDSPPQPPEANADLVSEAKHFFEAHFNLRRGNYQLFVVALSESDKVLCVSGFNFILFDSALNTLRAVADEYRYGKGIIDIPVNRPAFPRLHPLEDDEAQIIYQKLHHSLIGE